MKIVDFSIRRPVTITMFTVAVVIFGLISYKELPINLLPDLSYPTITVRTEYPGSAPAEVENLVTKPVEEAVGVVNNVLRVSSLSRPEVSEVMVEFNWGTNMDFASLDIREKLELLNLPQDVEAPILLRYDPSLEPIMRIGLSGETSLISLRVLAEQELKQKLESLEGVAAVKVSGGLEEEIQVEVNEPKLAALKIPISQVINRLNLENINLTGGSLIDGDTEFLVRTLNEFQSTDEIAEVVVGFRDEVPVVLGDVARVSRSYKERKIITRLSGQESVELAIYKEADANTVTVAGRVKERFEDFIGEMRQFSGAIRGEVVADQSVFIRNSVDQVLNAAVIGGILAIGILFLFLRNLRSTLIIGVAIPISVIATFFLMYNAGISMNIMSLGGLALGVGMLVDNAIVVLESIDRQRQQGMDLRQAASAGTSEVGVAVVAATLTTVCVFVPIIFVYGIAGQLFNDQALTVTFSLLASLAVAVTLIPMLASLQGEAEEAAASPDEQPGGIRGRVARAFTSVVVGIVSTLKTVVGLTKRLVTLVISPLLSAFEAGYGWLAAQYPVVLDWALQRRGMVMAGVVALALISALIFPFLGTELIPELSQGEFNVNIQVPVGTRIEDTSALVDRLERRISKLPEVARVYSIVGSRLQTTIGAADERENIATINVKLHAGLLRGSEDAVMETLRAQFSQVPSLIFEFARPALFSFRTPVEVEVRGYNLRTLESLSNRIAAALATIPGLRDVKSSTEGGNPEVQIIFNRQKLASLNMDVGSVGTVIRNKVQGAIATEMPRRDRKIDIRVRAAEKDRQDLDDLARLVINPQGEVPVPLASVADIRLERGPTEIRRVDQERLGLVTANVSGRDLGSVARDIQAALADIPVPPEFFVSISGQNEEMASSFASMRFAVLLAVFLVYLVMASQFESLLHPLVILFTIPFGLVGVVLTLFVTGLSISVVVLIGVIMLAGIVVNNAIVLVDYINTLRARGLKKREAILQAGSVRLRPIIMTTATTVLGLLPLAIGWGEGAEIRQPMAITVIGGLLVSTLLTLVVLPVVYDLMDRRA